MSGELMHTVPEGSGAAPIKSTTDRSIDSTYGRAIMSRVAGGIFPRAGQDGKKRWNVEHEQPGSRTGRIGRREAFGAEAEGATIFVTYPQDLRASAKIRALTACLRQAFGDPPYWDVG